MPFKSLVFISLMLPSFAFANCATDLADQNSFLSWSLKADTSVLEHPHEKRGFVTVPLDWNHPTTSRTTQIFYRLLPTQGGDVNDSTKPILVLMNGGPGYGSSRYRPLNFDYNTKDTGPLQFLSQSFRVMLVDQRGTAGNSGQIDFDRDDINPLIVARYASSFPVALDHAAIINEVIPRNEDFFIIAQSYGGIIGTQYLLNASKNPAQVRMPNGIAFTSAMFPHQDILDFARLRRKGQLDLNNKLRAAYPDVGIRIMALRNRVEHVIPGSPFVDCLFFMLGKGDNWQKKISDKVDTFLKADDATLVSLINEDPQQAPPALNYILSPATFQNGRTDRMLSNILMEETKFEDWMIDESRVYVSPQQTTPLLARTDDSPPPPDQYASIEEIRSAFSKTNVIFTGANDDPMVPLRMSRSMIERISPPKAKIVALNGGHSAIFFEGGYLTLAQEWLKTPKMARPKR